MRVAGLEGRTWFYEEPNKFVHFNSHGLLLVVDAETKTFWESTEPDVLAVHRNAVEGLENGQVEFELDSSMVRISMFGLRLRRHHDTQYNDFIVSYGMQAILMCVTRRSRAEVASVREEQSRQRDELRRLEEDIAAPHFHQAGQQQQQNHATDQRHRNCRVCGCFVSIEQPGICAGRRVHPGNCVPLLSLLRLEDGRAVAPNYPHWGLPQLQNAGSVSKLLENPNVPPLVPLICAVRVWSCCGSVATQGSVEKGCTPMPHEI